MLLLTSHTRSGGVGRGRASFARRATVGAQRRALTDAAAEDISAMDAQGLCFKQVTTRNFKVAVEEPCEGVVLLVADSIAEEPRFLYRTRVTCGQANGPQCQYSSVPVLQVDEGAKTATLTYHQVLPPTDYSLFGGNADLMEDGDIAYTLSALKGIPSAKVNKSRGTSTSQTVWEMDLNSMNAVIYRATRLPSLYPGVQW